MTEAKTITPQGFKPYPFASGLIVHVNSFTHKIDGGYLIENRKKIGKNLTARQVSAVIAADWTIRVSFTKV